MGAAVAEAAAPIGARDRLARRSRAFSLSRSHSLARALARAPLASTPAVYCTVALLVWQSFGLLCAHLRHSARAHEGAGAGCGMLRPRLGRTCAASARVPRASMRASRRALGAATAAGVCAYAALAAAGVSPALWGLHGARAWAAGAPADGARRQPTARAGATRHERTSAANELEAGMCVAIVLGCDLDAPALRARVAAGVRLLRSRRCDAILLSGGTGEHRSTSEAAAMRDMALRMGAPAAALLVEDRSVSTRTNAVHSLAVLDKHFIGGTDGSNELGSDAPTASTQVTEVLVVTSRFHTLRALRVFRRVAAERYGGTPPMVIAAPAGAGSWRQERDDMLALRATGASVDVRESARPQEGTCAETPSDESFLVGERLRQEAIAIFDFARELAALALYASRGWL